MPNNIANTINNTAINNGAQKESNAGTINEMTYILKDLTMNTVNKYEKLQNLSPTILNDQIKTNIFNQLSQDWGIKGLKVNVQV